MHRYYIDENNSGGRTVCLGVLSDSQPHYVYVDAESAKKAIVAFEKHFGVDWMYQNSFEGGSCNCCGRRFTLYTPVGEEEDWGIAQIDHDDSPYFKDEAIPLSECPVRGA